MSDQGEKIARSFGGLGFYRGCSIIFASSDKTSATTNSLSGSPINDKRDILDPNHHNYHHHSLHHHPASNHLLELQKEIKEEEEEIFADINSLINSRSNLYFTFDEDEEADDGVNLDEDDNSHFERPSAFNHSSSNTNNSANCSNSSSTNNNINSISSCEINNISASKPINSGLAVSIISRNNYHIDQVSDEHLFSSNSDDLNEYQNAANLTTAASVIHGNQHHHHDSTRGGLTNLEHTSHLDYQHDPFQVNSEQEQVTGSLSQEDCNRFSDNQRGKDFQKQNVETQYMDENAFVDCNEEDDNQRDYQALQAVIQQVQSNLPKPCVFFLEGNCRRSDCKYSHDLSNITCKYWIEGFCFKGEMCPFLHSYNTPSDSSLSESDGLNLLNKKELNPTFIIESEADFPSLPLDAPSSALNDSTKSSINPDAIATDIKNQILSSNSAVVFKTVKKKRKRG